MRIITFERYGAPEVLQYQEAGEQVSSHNEVLIRDKPGNAASPLPAFLPLSGWGMIV